MPVYQFICEKHGGFEKITIKAEWDDIRCPKCGDKMQSRAQKPLEKYLK
jgi:putative FmdB family regulatory protein